MLSRINLRFQILIDGLWNDTLKQQPPSRRWLIQALRIGHLLIHELRTGLLNLRAMSLVYTTLLSLVPLLAVSFSLLKGFGVHNQLEPLLQNLLSPLGPQGNEISSHIIGFVENTQAMALGSIGFALLLYTVISLMQKIELAFNQTWRVKTQRTLIQRFVNYLTVLIIGPILVMTALGLSASMLSTTLMQQLITLQGIGWLVLNLERLLPFVFLCSAFTFIYLLIPNTRVKFSSALLGGVIAAALWQTCGWLFASFVVESSNHAAVYSGFAALILFIIWLYLGWLILLSGSVVAYHHQYPRDHFSQPSFIQLCNEDREWLGFVVIQAISQRHYENHAPYSLSELAKTLAIPHTLLESVIQIFCEGNILIYGLGKDEHVLLPARPFDTLKFDEVHQLLRRQGESLEISLSHCCNKGFSNRYHSTWQVNAHDKNISIKEFTIE